MIADNNTLNGGVPSAELSIGFRSGSFFICALAGISGNWRSKTVLISRNSTDTSRPSQAACLIKNMNVLLFFFFLAEERYLGLAPMSCEVGDRIWIIRGCRAWEERHIRKGGFIPYCRRTLYSRHYMGGEKVSAESFEEQELCIH